MVVEVRRPAEGTRSFRLELLRDDPELGIALQRWPDDGDAYRVAEGLTLEPGSTLLWYLFPGRPYEVAAFHDPEGRLLGHYTNLIRPPEIRDEGEGGGRRWIVEDLFLDLWQPAGGGVRTLDRDELAGAVGSGAIDRPEAERTERLAAELAERSRDAAWPPAEVRRWPLERVEELRLRRNEPGLYWANLVTNRVIAFGIYFLGAAALTTLGFAAFTDGLRASASARTAWFVCLGVEAAGLAAASLAGRLPAARRLRREEVMTEATLFMGAAVTGVAVLLVQDSSLWRSLLAAIYGTLGFFLGVFGVSRVIHDRRPPVLALAGLVVCVAALLVLL